MIKGTMNTTTNLFILLIVTLFIFAATTIRYAQAQPGIDTPPEETPRVGGTVAQSMENNTTSPSGSTASNNTGNATR